VCSRQSSPGRPMPGHITHKLAALSLVYVPAHGMAVWRYPTPYGGLALLCFN
jgi:hypothetical protein